MQVPPQNDVRNQLLAALSPEDYDAVSACLEPVVLHIKDVLIAPDTPIGHVYFPESGIVSTVAVADDAYRIEVGIVGRDGFVGTPLVMGVDRTPFESFVQIETTGLRMPAEAFLALVDERPAFRTLLMRYSHVFQIQCAQTALANGAYDIPQRLARWLLMCADRTDGNEFQLTHEFLSMMLGVRRPGVTTAIHLLAGTGMIHAQRSRITIVDREKLADLAGESYGVAEREQERLITSGG